MPMPRSIRLRLDALFISFGGPICQFLMRPRENPSGQARSSFRTPEITEDYR
jgi:hypothetical protein